MWDIKPKVTNEQTRKINKQKLIDTDKSMVVTRGMGWGAVMSERGQPYGDRQ